MIASRWAESMVERGLRLRQDIDELVTGHMDVDSDAEDAVEPEIEYNAQELRRLMPYGARDVTSHGK